MKTISDKPIDQHEDPLVSVIIPVYNVEEFINSCLASVVNQDYKKIEIIIVDDGSTDNTNQICYDWAKNDPRISLTTKQNGGAGSARNCGISLANGKYIVMVDGDDKCELNMISTLVEVAKENDSELINFAFSAFDDHQELRNPVLYDYPKQSQSTGRECLIQTYKGHLGYFSWAYMYRSDIFKNRNIRYSEDVFLLEDALFLNKVLRAVESVSYIPATLYHYRVVSGSLTRRVSPINAESGYRAICGIIKMIKDDHLESVAVQQIINLLFFVYEINGNGFSKEQLLNRKLIKEEILLIGSASGRPALNYKTRCKILALRLGMFNILKGLIGKRFN